MSVRYHELLNGDEQRAAGVPDPAPIALADRVHHDEMDTLMHVNNVRYFVWFERLRIRFMMQYAIGALDDPQSPRTVIRSGEIRYLEEMVWGDEYIVTTRCTALRRTSFSLRQEIWAAGRARATFDCVMVLLSPDGATRHPIPDGIRARLIADGAAEETSTSA